MTPITETVLIVCVVATAMVAVTVTYLIVLLRMGRPLVLSFRGYGVDLSIGPVHLAVSEETEREIEE